MTLLHAESQLIQVGGNLIAAFFMLICHHNALTSLEFNFYSCTGFSLEVEPKDLHFHKLLIYRSFLCF